MDQAQLNWITNLKSRKTQQTLKDDFMAYLDGFSPTVQDILKNWRFITFAVKRAGCGSLRVSDGEDAKPTPNTL